MSTVFMWVYFMTGMMPGVGTRLGRDVQKGHGAAEAAAFKPDLHAGVK